MDIKCRKIWLLGVPCRPGSPAPPPSSSPAEIAGLATVPPTPSVDTPAPSGIAFGTAPGGDKRPAGGIPIPGYDAPALPVKPVRDPSLSLIALSGIDPSGPVMVEVPLVQNNTTFTADRRTTGLCVGVAERYEHGNDHERIEHRALFTLALETLRLAGLTLVPVPAQRADDSLRFGLHTRNEIDTLMSQYRLDALVSDSQSAAFHAACWTGYPRLGEPLGDGSTLWFYGARSSKDVLPILVRVYRNARRLTPVQAGLLDVLTNPTV